jgi:hypothetical protein
LKKFHDVYHPVNLKIQLPTTSLNKNPKIIPYNVLLHHTEVMAQEPEEQPILNQ